MAEGYLKDKCIGFVTEYLQRFDAIHWQVWDAEEEYSDAEEKYGDSEEVLEGAGRAYVMSAVLRDLAHQYTLKNMAIMQP
jgi:hypothetical protein